MSRSGERGPADRLLAALVALLVLAATLQSAPSAAAGGAAPVVGIVAPVVDISFASADLQSEARVEQLPSRTKITLDSTVLFAKDSATINARARARLREIGRDLRSRGPGSVRITGYTDDLGSAAHGRTLSKQRAQAVAVALSRSLPASSYPTSTAGRGERDPAVPNTSEANRRINRRVVILYVKP